MATVPARAAVGDEFFKCVPLIASRAYITGVYESNSTVRVGGPDADPVPDACFVLLLQTGPFPEGFPVNIVPESAPGEGVSEPVVVGGTPGEGHYESVISDKIGIG